MKQWSARLIAAAVAMGILGLSGCLYHSKKDSYYLISSNLKLPYWKTVSEGFSKAAAEYGVTARVDGADNYDTQAELAAFQRGGGEQAGGDSYLGGGCGAAAAGDQRGGGVGDSGDHGGLGCADQLAAVFHWNQ